MRRFPTLALVLISAACVSRGTAAPAAPAPDPEELVWAAVLQTFVTDSTERVIVHDSTLTFPLDARDVADLPRRLPGARVELVRSFAEANASRSALPAFTALRVPVVRVGEAGLASFGRGDPNAYWRAFYSAYPRSPGLIRLSRVGFDPERQQALVFVSHSCGGRCGSGAYLLLSNASGSWAVVGKSGEYVN
ncbi:MAG TPA: hypothetical protein VFZ18_13915 [Longimicrobiaceae bacterium]